MINAPTDYNHNGIARYYVLGEKTCIHLNMLVYRSIKNDKCILPYFGKRKQVTNVIFLVKEQNVSLISTDDNGILWYLT